MTNIKPEYTGQALDLKPAADPDEWQPMKDAPRTGEPIEVWHKSFKCVVTVRHYPSCLDYPWSVTAVQGSFSHEAFSGWRHPSKGPE